MNGLIPFPFLDYFLNLAHTFASPLRVCCEDNGITFVCFRIDGQNSAVLFLEERKLRVQSSLDIFKWKGNLDYFRR